MNVQTFLESGLLESYIMGQCTPEERALAEKMLAQHPELRAEQAQIEQALEKYALAKAIAPPAWMRGRILEQIPPAPPAAPTPSGTMNSKILSIALGICALTMLGLFLRAQQREEQTRTELRNYEKQVEECRQQSKLLEQLQAPMALIGHPDTKSANLQWLTPELGANGGRIKAFYNAELAQAYINTNALPALASNEDYQCWIIVDPKTPPVPLNVFDTTNTWQKIEYKPGAIQFAVSIEPKGGSPTGAPTKVVMAGALAG